MTKKMKLYDFPKAPNPRRVKIFAHEKDIELELINCDMGKREHKTPEFLTKNPSGKIPVLELENGECISESVAIVVIWNLLSLNQTYLVKMLMRLPTLKVEIGILNLNFGPK